MPRIHRPRQLASAALTAALALALAACTRDTYPNSTFHHTTEFNTAIDALWDRLLFLGTLVFVIVEALLVYTIVRFRAKPGQQAPKHVHGTDYVPAHTGFMSRRMDGDTGAGDLCHV